MKKIAILSSVAIGAVYFTSVALAQAPKRCSSDYMENKIYVLHHSLEMTLMSAMSSILDPFEKEAPPEKSPNGSYCLLEAFDVKDKNVSLYYHRDRGDSKIHYVATVDDGKTISHFIVQKVGDFLQMMKTPENFPIKTIYSLIYKEKNKSASISGFYGEPSFKVLKYMVSRHLKGQATLSKVGITMSTEKKKK